MGNLVLIAAIGKNGELGKNKQLIWHFREDMNFFKQVTVGRSIVMGRKTFESLPRILPHRTHIVLTSQDVDIPSVIVMHDKEEVLQYVSLQDNDVMIIGGGKVYQLFLNNATSMFLTEIDDECKEADVYFPHFNLIDWDRIVISKNQENGICFQHVQYVKKHNLKR